MQNCTTLTLFSLLLLLLHPLLLVHPSEPGDGSVIRRCKKKKKNQPATAIPSVLATLGAGNGLQQSREVPPAGEVLSRRHLSLQV